MIGAAATLGSSSPPAPPPAPAPAETTASGAPLLPPRPVVVIVEDTESFDNRVLSDLLLALSDAGDALPVCVLLGVATSASMMHGIIPAAVAARLRVESFRLWSPRAIMTAVQERVLLDPGFVPAPSNASLETLVTRFAEHDFSLSAARRAMHLLALDHFMTRELSSMAMCMTAASLAAAKTTTTTTTTEEEEEGENKENDAHSARDGIDAKGDASIGGVESRIAVIERRAKTAARAAENAEKAALASARAIAAETLTRDSITWARKNLRDFRTGEAWVGGTGKATKSDDDDACREEIARTIADAYGGRRRWATALRCVAAAADAVGYRRDEGRLAGLLVDASSTRWLRDDSREGRNDDSTAEGVAAEKTETRKASQKTIHATQGEKLLRLLCARLDPPPGTGDECAENRMSDADVASLALTWLECVSVDPAMYAEYEGFLRRTARLCDPAIAPRELREMEDARAARENAKLAAADSAAAKEKAAANQNRPAFASPPSARRARRASASRDPANKDPAKDGEAFATPAPRPPSATRTPSTLTRATRVDDAKVHPVSERAAGNDGGTSKRGSGTQCSDEAPSLADPNADEDEADPRRRARWFLRRVALKHASKPPASLRARELFCVGDASVRYLRSKAQAAPRLCVEQAMDTPRRVLGCACCPASGGPAATLPDTCCAYTLLQDMGDAANVHEWFREFCETNEPATGVPKGRGRGTGRAKSTGRAKKMARAGAGGNGSSLFSLPAPGDDGGKGGGDDDDGDDDDDEKKEKGTFHLERSRLWELQARFTRAVAEIEFLGVGRPVKRRKVEYMQRTAFPLDKLLGGDD